MRAMRLLIILAAIALSAPVAGAKPPDKSRDVALKQTAVDCVGWLKAGQVEKVRALFDAKMIVLLGRASPIGNAADNDALAARRLNAAKNWLFDACRATNHSDDECNALAARVAPAAVGQGRVIRRGEFIKAFHPTLRRSGQVVREKRWTLPVDETMMQAPNPIPGKRDIIKQNGAKQARADSVLAVALGRTNNRQHQRVAEQFMNQAAMFIPVPCSCKTN